MKKKEILEIPWTQIRPMPDQPRTFFDRTKLNELAQSIAAVGQTTPIEVVRLPPPPPNQPRPQLYEINDGQRRWHAVQMIGLETLTAVAVETQSQTDRFKRSVVSNFCREGHQPMELARAFQRMKQTMTSMEIAKAIGRSHPYVTGYLALLELHPDLQEMLDPNLDRFQRLPIATAFKLASLTKDRQLDAYAKIRQSKASHKEATQAVMTSMPIEARRTNLSRGLVRSRNKRGDIDRLIAKMNHQGRELEAFPEERFTRLMQGTPTSQLQTLDGVLERVEAQCQRLRELLGVTCQ